MPMELECIMFSSDNHRKGKYTEFFLYTYVEYNKHSQEGQITKCGGQGSGVSSEEGIKHGFMGWRGDPETNAGISKNW